VSNLAQTEHHVPVILDPGLIQALSMLAVGRMRAAGGEGSILAPSVAGVPPAEAIGPEGLVLWPLQKSSYGEPTNMRSVQRNAADICP